MVIEFIKPPHIGQFLRKYVKEKRIYQAAWGRRQGVTAVTIARYFKRETMKISTLFTISQVLKYNFFREIADMLPPEFPSRTEHPLVVENEKLKKEIERLQLQVEVWKEAAGMKKS